MGQVRDQNAVKAFPKSYKCAVIYDSDVSPTAKYTKASTCYQPEVQQMNVCQSIRIPWTMFNLYFKQMNKKRQNFSSTTLRQSFWSNMTLSFRLLMVIVISCMTEFAVASNESIRNGRVGVRRTNDIPKDGPYKSAQSAASVSNIVGGHYQTINDEDESSPHTDIMADSNHYTSTIDDHDEGYWREVKAIIGGVLGFWGGIGSLGTLFLVVVMSKRYCCREVDDKEGDKDG